MEKLQINATRGISTPVVVDLTSSMADASGVILADEIPTWAKLIPAESRSTMENKILLFMIM